MKPNGNLMKKTETSQYEESVKLDSRVERICGKDRFEACSEKSYEQ